MLLHVCRLKGQCGSRLPMALLHIEFRACYGIRSVDRDRIARYILSALGSHTTKRRSHHTGKEVEDLRVVVIMNHVVARTSSLPRVRYLQVPASTYHVIFSRTSLRLVVIIRRNKKIVAQKGVFEGWKITH